MASNEIFAREEALDRVENDKELLLELVDMFFAEYDEALGSMRSAIEKGDANSLERTAHSQKSALGNIGANASSNVAKELEMMGRNKSINNAAERLKALEETVILFKAAIEEFKSVN